MIIVSWFFFQQLFLHSHYIDVHIVNETIVSVFICFNHWFCSRIVILYWVFLCLSDEIPMMINLFVLLNWRDDKCWECGEEICKHLMKWESFREIQMKNCHEEGKSDASRWEVFKFSTPKSSAISRRLES